MHRPHPVAPHTVPRGIRSPGKRSDGSSEIAGRGLWTRLLLPLAGSGCLLCACESTRGPTARDRQQEVNDELYSELIGQSSLTPVEGFDPGHFSNLEREYADGGAEEGEPAGEGAGESTGGEEQAGDSSETGEAPAEGEQAPQEEEPEGPIEEVVDALEDLWGFADPADIPINPYLEFGENIIEYEDGRIMKPYPLPSGQGEKIDRLLRQYGRFEIFTPDLAEGETAPPTAVSEQPPGTVALDLQTGWLTEAWADPRDPQLVAGAAVPLGDVLFVTASPELMREVEHFIDLFAAEVRQIEIEAKIVEVTTTDTLELGITPLDDTTPILGLPNSGGLLRSFSYAFPVSEAASLLTVGAVQDGAEFNAVLQAFAGLENVSIISRPKVAVREGGRAEIVNTTRVPYLKLSGLDNEGSFSANVEYLDVGVQMYVIPRVVGTNTVVLNIDIEASQQTGNQVTFATRANTPAGVDQEITTPVLAIRKARTIVRLEPGQAVVIGGLISERTVETERKVPLLGDIPLLGMLFRSDTRTKEQTNVLFFIRPRILQGSDLNRPFE